MCWLLDVPFAVADIHTAKYSQPRVPFPGSEPQQLQTPESLLRPVSSHNG